MPTGRSRPIHTSGAGGFPNESRTCDGAAGTGRWCARSRAIEGAMSGPHWSTVLVSQAEAVRGAHEPEPHEEYRQMNTLPGTQPSRSAMWRTGVALLAMLATGATWAADPGARYKFDIPPQRLATALVEFSRQAGTQIVSDAQDVGPLGSPGVSGEMPLQDALGVLLNGTKLAYRATDGGVIAVGLFAQAAASSASQTPAGAAAAPATPKPDSLEEIIVTSTKIETPIIEVPQSMSVISRDQLEMRGVNGVTEALRYTPGTIVDNYGYEPRGYEYIILRGFDALYTGNYRDGLNQATGLYFSSFITEPYDIERIEVIRGPASALFGQADAGGIVNRISKRPDPNMRSEVEAQFGNHDRKQVAVDFGGALNDSESLVYRLVGVGLDTENQQRYPNGDRPTIETLFAAPSLMWKISEDTSLTLLTDFRKGDVRGTFFYAAWPDGTFSGIASGDPDFIRYEHEQASAGYQFEHTFNDVWSFRQNFRFETADVQVKELFRLDFDADGHTMNRYAVRTDEGLDQILLDSQLHATLPAGSATHNLLVGIDASRMDADLKFYLGAAPSLDLLNPVYGQPIDTPNDLAIDARQKNELLGFYAQDKLEIGKWIFNVGVRYDRVESLTTPALVDPVDEDAFTGRGGLIYRFDGGLAPYVSYTQSFLPQSGVDASGQPFKSSRGTQYEVGLKYEAPGGRGLYTIALFDLTKDNVLTPDFVNDGFFLTTGERRSRGVELEANAHLGGGFSLAAQYSYLDAEVTRSNDVDLGKRPIQVPEHTASAWLDYVFSGTLQGLGLSAGVRYVGTRFDDRENLFESPSYTLFDAAIHYDRGAWRFALNSANLGDKKYFATGSVASGYYPGVRRTIIASAKYRW
ncbi:MAG: TonB-dependent siderophore receptor [Steroidobacteraceae bacterium]